MATLVVFNQLLLASLVLLLVLSMAVKVARVFTARLAARRERLMQPWVDRLLGEGLPPGALATMRGWRARTLERLVLRHLPYLMGALQERLVGALDEMGAIARLRRRLRNSPNGWTRSLAAYWLGIVRSQAAFEDLLATLRDRDKDVRWAAARALVHLPRSSEAVLPLIELLPALPFHRAEAIIEEIVQLGVRERPEVKAMLTEQFRHQNPVVRYWAVVLMGEAQTFEATGALEGRLKDADPLVREAAARALGKLGDPQTFHAVCLAATDPDWRVRLAAVETVQKLGHPGAVPALIKAVLDRQWEVNEAAIRAISALDPQGAVLRAMLRSPHEFVRWRAAEVLELRGDLDAMIAAFPSASHGERGEMLEVLRLAAHNRAAQPFLRHMASTPHDPQAEPSP